MTTLNSSDLEIAGLNGVPSVECGRSLPIVRRMSDGLYSVLNTGDLAALKWHDQEEADAFAMAKRWTKLRSPLPFPSECISSEDGRLNKEPMMVHVAQALLTASGLSKRPEKFHGQNLVWTSLEGEDDDLQAACGAAWAVEALLDNWGECLKKEFDREFPLHKERSTLAHITNCMLSAAKSRPLRWQAYLRHALVQPPEAVERTFRFFTTNEFPDAPWDDFLKDMKALGDVLARIPPAASSLSTSAKTKLHDIARRTAISVHERAAA